MRTIVTQQKPNLKETEMKTKTIKTPNFMGKAAKIVEEIRNSICIDDVDAEVLKEILQDELNEYCRMLDGYYAEEYYNNQCAASCVR